MLALEVTGLTLPAAGGLSVAGVLGLAGKLEALVDETQASGFAALGLGVDGTTFGLGCATSGFAGLTVALELG